MIKYNKELLKGTTPMLVLTLLSTKDMYGYEIIKKMEEISNYSLSVKQGSLYPILHNLEEDGCLVAYWEKTNSDRKKKFYHLTDLGLKKLDYLINEWNHYSESIYSVINRKKIYDWKFKKVSGGNYIWG